MGTKLYKTTRSDQEIYERPLYLVVSMKKPHLDWKLGKKQVWNRGKQGHSGTHEDKMESRDKKLEPMCVTTFNL